MRFSSLQVWLKAGDLDSLRDWCEAPWQTATTLFVVDQAVSNQVAPLRTNNWTNHILVTERAVLTTVPKAGCTTLKAQVAQWKFRGTAFTNEDLHSKGAGGPLRYLSEEEVSEITLKEPKKSFFSMVRHPETRTLAAFLDKLLIPSSVPRFALTEEQRKWHAVLGEIRLFHSGLARQPRQRFRQFLEWLEFEFARGSRPNEHWDKQVNILGLAPGSYELIGRFENFAPDAGLIFSRMGIDDFDFTNPVRGTKVTNATALLDDYYSKQNRALLQRIYREDFEALNY